ncbi:zinc-binding protein A33-like isoform X2 [Protopterus annectens]|uniref:zinc-binding protein A33-like isoform X2 n=1 Tax=Protopterus annectens TaxID=7888 RepID=UPI001CFBA8BF|nr:zinc-binding protein A33-like isoform X2 [Protopterus annectens]
MASCSNSNELLSELVCSVCLELFQDAATLECGHSFCKSCLDRKWDSEKNSICPKCRALISERKYMRNNVLSNMADRAREMQIKGETNEKTQIKPSDLSQRAEVGNTDHFCKEHSEKLKLFCKEDETPICYTCVDSLKHCGHNFIPLHDAVSIYKEKLTEAKFPLETHLNEIEELQEKQMQRISEVNTKAMELHIKSEFATLHAFLQNKEQQLIQKLREEKERTLKEMEENLRCIKEFSDTIQTQMHDIQSWLEQNDALHILQNITAIENLLTRSQKNFIKSSPKLVKHGITLGVYKGPLQYGIWKEMLSVINPGLTSITFDPNTAHPNLELCEDFTRVKNSGIYQRPLTDSPEQFSLCACVLGLEAFTTGRHYWEVEVGQNNSVWDVGVTQASSNRRGNIQISPKNGYWTVSLRQGILYTASDSACEALSAKPQKMGVYLDYEGGQVSFYDAGDMVHLYTFTCEFNEKLHPYFYPGLKGSAPLKLFHLCL